jgi:hypothetical protein
MDGESPAGGTGGSYTEGTTLDTGGSGQYGSAGASTAVAEPEVQDDSPETQQPQGNEQTPSALSSLAERLTSAPVSPTAQRQSPPPPAAQIQSQIQQIQAEHVMDERELAAHLQYLPEDQQELVLAKWEGLKAQRMHKIVQLERELGRSELEPHNRELAISELARLAKADNPRLDDKKMVAHLQKYGQKNASAEMMLQLAIDFADGHRQEVLEARKSRGTDKMGSGLVQTTDKWKGMNTMQKLTLALREGDRAKGRS